MLESWLMYLILYSSLQTWILNRLLGQLTVQLHYYCHHSIIVTIWRNHLVHLGLDLRLHKDWFWSNWAYLSDTDTLDSWAQLGMWPTLAISQSGDNQQKQLVLIGLILQTPSADNSAKYSRNQKSARDPEWQGEYSAIHAGQMSEWRQNGILSYCQAWSISG